VQSHKFISFHCTISFCRRYCPSSFFPSTCQGRRFSTRSGYISISFVVYSTLFFQQRDNGRRLPGTCISPAARLVLILSNPQQIFLTSLHAVQLLTHLRIFISAASAQHIASNKQVYSVTLSGNYTYHLVFNIQEPLFCPRSVFKRLP